MKSLFFGLIVLILLTTGFIYLVNTDSPNTSTSTPPTQNESEEVENEQQVTIPSDFRLHGEPAYQYSIALPYTVDVSSPQARINRYRYVGPNNEPNSEITDGYTITIESETTTATSLEDFALEITANDSNESNVAFESVTVAGESSLRYTTISALGNKPVTNYVFLPGNGYGYIASVNISPVEDESYEATTIEILNTLQFLDATTAEAVQSRIIPIAMLDYDAVGSQYIRESSGTERGCDRVVLIEHVLAQATSAPLNASLEQLFAYERDTVGGWQNFVSTKNDSLTFDRAELDDGTAQVYLSGELGNLGGVCDNPRTAIQIEETALAYPSVNTVELYLNEEPTDLIPSGRGE